MHRYRSAPNVPAVVKNSEKFVLFLWPVFALANERAQLGKLDFSATYMDHLFAIIFEEQPFSLVVEWEVTFHLRRRNKFWKQRRELIIRACFLLTAYHMCACTVQTKAPWVLVCTPIVTCIAIYPFEGRDSWLKVEALRKDRGLNGLFSLLIFSFVLFL